MTKKTIISGRTQFPRSIVAEFWMPVKPSGKAIILCDGCPSVPSKHRLGEFLARKGYWVFHPRYRGSWESGGEFLKYPPCEDVLLVAKHLNDGFVDLWSNIAYSLDISDVTVMGASFGGSVAILSTLDPIVNRAVALSPAIDFQDDREGESFAEFVRQLEFGFKGAYRFNQARIGQLRNKRFFNPSLHTREIDPSKLIIVHALDDRIIPIRPLRAFQKITRVRTVMCKTGGHFSTSAVMQPDIWKHLRLFLKK